ncbi:MAG: type II toxin-antitoxin system Phd/YefM family antitoxin [Spirochaetaceae bacterium]
MLDAKTHLSRFISEIEDHREDEIIIARNGHPVARLRAIDAPAPDAARQRVGAARGAFTVPDDIDSPYGDLIGLFTDGKSDTGPNSQ